MSYEEGFIEVSFWVLDPEVIDRSVKVFGYIDLSELYVEVSGILHRKVHTHVGLYKVVENGLTYETKAYKVFIASDSDTWKFVGACATKKAAEYLADSRKKFAYAYRTMIRFAPLKRNPYAKSKT